ncbi:MAG: putative sulfate/molybdate transporter [Actinobacteria bacterium]|nr:putative sulfate/molybdate transporter [Actinomycetota bacterium]
MRIPSFGDLAGAVADLGVLVPLVAALVLVNGLDPGPVLVMAGVLSIAAGLWFGVPFPVQPLKAMTALAVAQALPPDVIRAAGLLLGLLLVALRVTGLADRVAAAFTTPVIRSLQLAVGVLLVVTAARLVLSPPALFTEVAPLGWADVGGVSLPSLGLSVPPVAVWASAFVLLVVPQLPLTYGNAVVGLSHLAREEFPSATRVTPGAVALSCGIGNVAAALVGGMPMCHGSSGFTAHVRLGARTPAMNVVLGGSLVLLGALFAGQVLSLFALLPVWGLAGLLAYAGVRHAALVLDLRGGELAMAVAAAAAGIVTGNLAVTTAIALAVVWLPRLRQRHRQRDLVAPAG